MFGFFITPCSDVPRCFPVEKGHLQNSQRLWLILLSCHHCSQWSSRLYPIGKGHHPKQHSMDWLERKNLVGLKPSFFPMVLFPMKHGETWVPSKDGQSPNDPERPQEGRRRCRPPCGRRVGLGTFGHAVTVIPWFWHHPKREVFKTSRGF